MKAISTCAKAGLCLAYKASRLQDALDEVARQLKQDLFKPLRVHFIGEEGIDAGGVKKEFFQLLITELLSPDYGMLIFQPVSLPIPSSPCTLGLSHTVGHCFIPQCTSADLLSPLSDSRTKACRFCRYHCKGPDVEKISKSGMTVEWLVLDGSPHTSASTAGMSIDEIHIEGSGL